MAKSVYQVEGARQFRATLRSAGDDLSDMKATHAKVATIVENRTRTLAPATTGRLKDTIRSSGTKTYAVVRVGKAKVPYANPIHWGWGRRHIKRNPFVSRAAQETEPIWSEVYFKDLEHILDQIKGT